MPRRTAAILLVLLLIGGNAAVVQSVAWVGMLADRAASMDWSDAVESTFSGAQPCPMCHAASALREEGGPGQPAPEVKQPGKLAFHPSALPAFPDLTGGLGDALVMPGSTARPDDVSLAPSPPPPRS